MHIGLLTGPGWGPPVDRGEDILQGQVVTKCSVYIDDMMPTALNDNVENKIALVGEPPLVAGTHWYDYAEAHSEHFKEIISFWPGWNPRCTVKHSGIIAEVWIYPQDRKLYEKSKSVSAVFSHKNRESIYRCGYTIRHQIANKLHTLIDIYGTINGAIDLPGDIGTKLAGIQDYSYHVVVENQWGVSGTEKLHDPIACGSVPIYWGDKNSPIFDYYNKDGIIIFSTVQELEHILCNVISDEDYNRRLPAIKENLQKVKQLNWSYFLKQYLNLNKYVGK